MAHQNLIQNLDRIASHLESLGMVKEAHDLDVVSNTIEAAFSTCASSYDKYLLSTPADGGEYYSLDIPKDVDPPKEGDSLKLGDVNVVVFTVSTPDKIRKGRGGPVATAMERAGIGWRVNCLPKGHKYLGCAAGSGTKETGTSKTARFFSQEELRRKGKEHAEKIYKEYVDSARGKKAYDKALKAHPDYNRDKVEADAATDMILEDVGKWLEDKGKSEAEANLWKDSLKGKILAGIT